jgi:hypothetical protein
MNTSQDVIAVSHASAVVATAVGVGVTLAHVASPVYGLTLACALAACANGMKSRAQDDSTSLKKGRRIQRGFCSAGSVLCAAAAATVTLELARSVGNMCSINIIINIHFTSYNN